VSRGDVDEAVRALAEVRFDLELLLGALALA
jgi:hypothetical protein